MTTILILALALSTAGSHSLHKASVPFEGSSMAGAWLAGTQKSAHAAVEIDSPSATTAENVASSPKGADPNPVEFVDVATKAGVVRGVKTTAVRKFLGIPYAVPPVEDLRWRSPVPSPAWNGTRDALEFERACPQKENVFIKENSEDCLYLNVFTPADISQKLPVMVFIHGGAYEQGGASIPIYTGENIVQLEKVAVVTFNYRLGSLGFLGGSILRLRSPDGSMGNYGLQDQRLAMQWVKDNIEAFGGDVSRVLIFGESAGAGSVAAHLINPRSVGLFTAAVMESGAYSVWQAIHNTTADATFDRFVRAASCSDSPDLVACLVALPIEQLLEAQASVTFGSASLNWAPTVDGVELLEWPETMAARGEFYSKVPCILGTNSAEAAALVMGLVGPTLNESTYRSSIEFLFGAAAPLILFEYPVHEYPSAWWALEAMITDALFACPARRTAKWMDKIGMSAYQYYFSHTPTLTVIPECIAPCHTSELPYVFHVPSLLANDVERALSKQMVGYWSSLAALGRPHDDVGWPEYNRFFDRALILNATISIAGGMRAKQCTFWDLVENRLPHNNGTKPLSVAAGDFDAAVNISSSYTTSALMKLLATRLGL